MPLRLESSTILDYLVQQGLCGPDDEVLSVKALSGKNLNLLVQLSTGGSHHGMTTSLLVKQAPFRDEEGPKQSFLEEWRIYQLLDTDDQLRELQPIMSEGVNFDATNGILVLRFVERYWDLGKFYAGAQQFPAHIATALGIGLATLHQATFQRRDYQLQLAPECTRMEGDRGDGPDFCGELENLTPGLFRRVSLDGLMFYKLYQRSAHLSEALSRLQADYTPCCLIHNDLKFGNILVHQDWPRWEPSPLPTSLAALHLPDQQGVIRVIDWEQWAWGDPAFDVGAIITEYLRIWLQSLALSRDIDLAVSLQLAAVPLQTLQPSLAALIKAYLAQFPAILEVFPDFQERVLRFAGLGLIEVIQERLFYREPFGNLEISILQVARSLLCHPEAAMSTVFGDLGSHFSGIEPPDSPPSEMVHVAFSKAHCTNSHPASHSEVFLPRWLQHYSLDAALADLTENVRIDPPLIEHPSYALLDVTQVRGSAASETEAERYNALPDELKQADLLRQLRNYLYDIYFSGEQESRLSMPTLNTEYKNSTYAGLDLDFIGQIQAANSGTGCVDPNWVVTRVEGSRYQVQKDGLHLWIDPTADLALGSSEGSVGTRLSLRLPNSSFVGEYYMAVGNGGQPATDQASFHLFFHVTVEGAILLMEILSCELNRESCPFTLKVLAEPLSYGRFDAAILTLESRHYVNLRAVLQHHYPRLRPHLQDPIPLFTAPLAPGIGLAEAPGDAQGFGLGRCKILARALLAAEPFPRPRQWAIQQHFAEHSLDWQRPHLNPGSRASYPPLDLRDCDEVAAASDALCHPH